MTASFAPTRQRDVRRSSRLPASTLPADGLDKARKARTDSLLVLQVGTFARRPTAEALTGRHFLTAVPSNLVPHVHDEHVQALGIAALHGAAVERQIHERIRFGDDAVDGGSTVTDDPRPDITEEVIADPTEQQTRGVPHRPGEHPSVNVIPAVSELKERLPRTGQQPMPKKLDLPSQNTPTITTGTLDPSPELVLSHAGTLPPTTPPYIRALLLTTAASSVAHGLVITGGTSLWHGRSLEPQISAPIPASSTR